VFSYSSVFLLELFSYQVPLESVPLDMLQRDELIRKYAQRAEADKKVVFGWGGGLPAPFLLRSGAPSFECVFVCLCLCVSCRLPPFADWSCDTPLGMPFFVFLCVFVIVTLLFVWMHQRSWFLTQTAHTIIIIILIIIKNRHRTHTHTQMGKTVSDGWTTLPSQKAESSNARSPSPPLPPLPSPVIFRTKENVSVPPAH
jgi:hypothetical protein